MQSLIKKQIQQFGPMPLFEYMMLALYHPDKGYYSSKQPFGSEGDFITAPELSSFFGEFVGAWVIDFWLKLNCPKPFHLIELGPGRGILMEDILRVAKLYPEFHEALHIHLVEISPALKSVQKEAVQHSHLTWHDNLEELPVGDCLFIGNEFFDALPIRQFQMHQDKWHETYVTCADEKLEFCLVESKHVELLNQEKDLSDCQNGACYEINEAALQYLDQIQIHLEANNGGGLFFDYGHSKPDYQDSLRAFHKHTQLHPLEKPGHVDITSNVPFFQLSDHMRKAGYQCQMIEQGRWLSHMGYKERASIMKTKHPEASASIDQAMNKLLDPKDMGAIFKAFAFSKHDCEYLGFSNEVLKSA